MLWLGIDVGGTFTDLVLYDDESGRLALAKTPSTPQDHSEGMLAGITRLGIPLEAVTKLAHGTTIATNTVLERTGAPTAMITTRGFRDVLEVGRGNRERIGLYDIKATRPPALVPRSLRLEVDERTLYDGTVFREVDPEAVAALAATLQARGIQAIAICFLHAYANDRNETRAKAAVRKAAPDLFVANSAEVLAEYREYERFATTVLNVYVAPRVGRYLGNLRARLAERGFRQEVAIMTSNGGTMSARLVAAAPVHSMLSGPAAGVIGATLVARQIGQRDLVTYDMGGTSTDVCLVKDLEFAMSTEGRIGHLPNRVSQIEINSIGAGGGSIAWLGAGKFVSVGPQSAGAVPGPACYGRGGAAPTVTDANLLLGRLHPGEPLGGEIHLRPDLARAAVARLAADVGIDPLRMADGIVRIAVAKMTGAIKEISVMRGHDPRGFTLFAYGGAGPLHAALIAAELAMPRVMIPPLPGNFSAFGLLAADVRHDYVRTRLVPTRGLGFEQLGAGFAELRDEARSRLGAEGFAPEAMRFEARLDMRYVGQAFELSVPVHEDWTSMADVDAAFYAAHEQRYAHAVEDPVEIVSVRVSAYGLTTKPALPARLGGATSLGAARLGVRPVFFDDGFVDTPVYVRDRLPAAARVRGPALVDEPGTTTVIPPGFHAAVGELGVLMLERGERE